MQHILSSEQFREAAAVDEILNAAVELAAADAAGSLPACLAGKLIACLFFEPSTRTRLSFTAAALKLGGQVMGMEHGTVSSSVSKGETMYDTGRVVSGLADAIVIRHAREGAADEAARDSAVPVINAGDGGNQHPTQALLDVYTIWQETGRLRDLHIVMAGDLLYGRTIHSTLTLLSLYAGNHFYFVAPKRLRLPDTYIALLKQRNITFTETEDLREVLPVADVVYMTRVQQERFTDVTEYERYKGAYFLDAALLARLGPRAVIMHALPRVHEMALEVDADPRAAYFRQAKNGLYIRMAILQLLLA